MRRWLLGTAHAALAVIFISLPAPGRAQMCGAYGEAGAVAAAIFHDPLSACDLNRDGAVSAADTTAAVLSVFQPTATATNTTATPAASPTFTPTNTGRSPTAVLSATATRVPATPTTGRCPSAGGDLVIEVDNRTGRSPFSVVLTGQRLGDECTAGALKTSYRLELACAGSGILACGSTNLLAPGMWRHSIRVVDPSTDQAEHQASLILADAIANRIRFTAFGSAFSVRTKANEGDGSLRNALQSADTSAKPFLIQFDSNVFPAGTPITIHLDFQLPVLATSDVTIDGIDAGGAAGNRIIDAGGLPITALAITGSRNRVVGMRLQNVGGNDRDVLNISGPLADGNVIEHTVIEGSAAGDGVGVDQEAGKSFADSANVVRDCEIAGAADKGIKITAGAYARVERSWVHDNANGGIQATLGGHVRAWHNLVERNRGSTAQNGLSVNADDDPAAPSGYSELDSWGNIARGNGANGISVRAFSFAHVRDDYLATNSSSGLRIFNDVGPAATAAVEGTSAVCNGVDGAVVANSSIADLGGGLLGSPGNNAFTQNNLPGGGANLRNATGMPLCAINAQWEHCGFDTTCDDTVIAAYDVSDHGANTTFIPSQAHRSQQPPVLTGVAPIAGEQGDLLRIFGSGFNVIDGHFAEDNCADVAGRNRCVPLRGNCVRINGSAAAVEAVTPTMLVVRWPFTCIEPVALIVETSHGGTSAPFTVCTNAAPPS